MRTIGGFFETEMTAGSPFHNTSYQFCLARHALAAILINRKIRKLYLPEYLCSSLIDACAYSNTKPAFYGLKDIFTPILPSNIRDNEAILLINYFGVVNMTSLIESIPDRIIVDNSQSFFSPAQKGVDTFYSARKYFGVPDGSYLYTDLDLENWYSELPSAKAYGLMKHQVERSDGWLEEAYQTFQSAKLAYKKMDISKISKYSTKLLEGIDYESCKNQRLHNFKILDGALMPYNQIDVKLEGTPMYYPLVTSNGAQTRARLIEKRVFVPMYWPNIDRYSARGSEARRLTNDMVCLPIDHRYGEKEMKFICSELIALFGE